MKIAIKYGLSITVVVMLWVLVTHFLVPLAPESKANMLAPILFNVAAMVAIYLGIPVLVFALLVGTVNAINYSRYGVFINNDFRAHHFPAAYGALARIEHERWRPYVVFPADARRKAYQVSPAARAHAASRAASATRRPTNTPNAPSPSRRRTRTAAESRPTTAF